MKAPKQEIEISKTVKDLDKILKVCSWRLSNHYLKGEWEKLAQDTAGSDLKNPMFRGYISFLKEEGLIRDAPDPQTVDEAGFHGCINTAKGEMFEGFENKIRREHAEKVRIITIETNAETSQNQMVKLTLAVVAVGIFPALNSLVELIKFLYSYCTS